MSTNSPTVTSSILHNFCGHPSLAFVLMQLWRCGRLGALGCRLKKKISLGVMISKAAGEQKKFIHSCDCSQIKLTFQQRLALKSCVLPLLFFLLFLFFLLLLLVLFVLFCRLLLFLFLLLLLLFRCHHLYF